MTKSDPREATTMRLPKKLKKRLAERAEREGRSSSNLTIKLLEEGLKKRQRVDAKEATADVLE